MMNSERINYYEIKRDFLDCCYAGCRAMLSDFITGSPQWPEDTDERGYASYQYEGVYQLPIEQLMLAVINLILMAARGPEYVEIFHRKEIQKILSAHPINELLQELGEEEREELLYDMKLLKLI